MTWFNTLSTRAKLLASFGLVLLLLCAVIGCALWSVNSLQDAYVTAMSFVERRAAQNLQHSQLLALLASDSPDDQKKLEGDIRKLKQEIDQMNDRIRSNGQGDKQFLQSFEEIESYRQRYREIRDEQLAKIQEGKADDARLHRLTEQSGHFADMRRLSQEMSDQFLAQAEDRVSTLRIMLAMLGVVALILALGLVTLLTRLIATPLQTFTQFVQRVGQGDLRQKAITNGQASATTADEVGRLGFIMNEMVAGLRDMAGQTIAVTGNLNAASAEILASTQEQAAGTRQQAATIQQITTTMEEVRQSGAQISERAKEVAAVAEGAAAASAQGTRSVQDASRTMESIRSQVEELAENIVALSEKTLAVGEIIATVNDIAERSNLLALNAAIEAASAGDQGNRFAVVAGEMKNLADQAKDSTVQVRGILGDIQKGINRSVMLTEEAVKRVEVGRQQADTTEQTIRQLADTTQESVQAFQQIIAATGQQQIGFEQVTQGMLDIRQAASQSAVGTLQLEKAVASLNAQSQQLLKAVGRYQLDGH